MIKLTVLYGHPTDPAAFENYYATTHMPLSAKMSGVLRHEKAKVVGTPTGDKPPYYGCSRPGSKARRHWALPWVRLKEKRWSPI